MTYERINFVDQSVERPRTYEMTHNTDGSVTLVDSFGLVDELGTPINADTMNHLEDGIAAAAIRIYNESETFALGDWVLGIVENEKNIYKSLQDNNVGNSLSDKSYWEVVELGVGGGREVGEFVTGFWSAGFVPKNLLYCDGAELSGAEGQMFRNLWTDYILTGKLDTCSYSEYETEVTMTGSCWKWAVDTANEKFRIPFIPDKVLTDINDIVPVIGNGMVMGFDGARSSGSVNVGLATNDNAIVATYAGLYGENVGTKSSNIQTSQWGLGLTTNPEMSGIEAHTTNDKTYKKIRHFVVVATGSINQSEMDWSAWASSLQGKANTDLSNCTRPYIVEVSDKSLLPSWYRIWSDGWCEQGSTFENSTQNYTGHVVTLMKEYVDINYSVLTTGNYTSNGGGVTITSVAAIAGNASPTTTSTFTMGIHNQISQYSWEAKGYIK